MQFLLQNPFDAPQKIEKHSVVIFVLHHCTWIPVERVRLAVGGHGEAHFYVT
jgi:hypothetical protein